MPEQLVVFRVAGEPYALPIAVVREVVATAPRRRLPATSAPWVVGLASIRGELMAVVDLAVRLGAAPAPGDDDSGVLLVVDHEERTVAVVVDVVDRIVDAPAELAPAPAYAGDAAAAIAEIAGELIVVLRPGALVPPA